jgi:hypothetical protein
MSPSEAVSIPGQIPNAEADLNAVVLIVLVCSIVNPGVCSEKQFLLESSGTLKSCVMEAQPYLAAWIGEHPNQRIASWRCAWPGSEGRSL